MPASIFAGSKVKTLKDTLSLNGQSDIISRDVNPQTSAVDAKAGSLLLNYTSGIMYRKLDAGSTTNWVEVGAGTGGKNYIKNNDFDGGATTSWSMQKVSLSSFIPTGNIGAADAGHSIATSSSSPLEGANSLLVQGASAFTAGNCLVSAAFAIDREDVAKVMGWSFAYEAITTNMDFSGTTGNTWAVYIAEVTTGTPNTVVSWIQPAGVYNLTQGVGVGLAAGTFQTTATESSAYRIVLVCINSEAAATTLKVDDFQLGPQKVVYGSPVTDWQSFTPTVSGISGTMTGKWRRVGDSAEFEMALTTSGAASGTITVSVTSAFAFDYTKLPVSAFANIGSASANDGTGIHLGTCFTDNTSTNSFFISGDDGQNIWNATVPFTWSGTRTVSFSVKVPLAGLSSSVQMSQDTDTRVVAARWTKSSDQAANNGTQITFDSIVKDTHAAWNTGSSYYKVPVTGFYDISVNAYVTGATAGVGLFAWSVDGGVNKYYFGGGSLGADRVGGSVLTYFTAGQQITIYWVGSNSVTIKAGDTNTGVTFALKSGPATIAASETVALSAYTTAAQSIPNGGATVVYGSKNYDSHAIINTSTGVATIPVSGKYLIEAIADFTVTSTAGTRALDIVKGVSRITSGIVVSGAVGASVRVCASIVSNFVAGDLISVFAYQNSGGSLSLSASATENLFTITRVGN